MAHLKECSLTMALYPETEFAGNQKVTLADGTIIFADVDFITFQKGYYKSDTRKSIAGVWFGVIVYEQTVIEIWIAVVDYLDVAVTTLVQKNHGWRENRNGLSEFMFVGEKS